MVHLVAQQPAQAAVVTQPVQQVAYVAAQPAAAAPAQAVLVSGPANPPQPVVHNPGPLRRMIGHAGEAIARVGWQHVHIPPAGKAPAAATTPVQLVMQPASAAPTSAAVYAAPPAPPVPSAQH
jgi:hypothetical protein